MPRLSITLTDSQNAALERISKETGATKQSMIGLAVSAWIREHDYIATRERMRIEDRDRAEAVRNAQSDAELADWEEWDRQTVSEPKTPQNRHQGGTTWYGWCRTWSEDEGSRDRERKGFATEHEAIMHAKLVTQSIKGKASGHIDARPFWEECNAEGIPVALL